MINEYNKLNKLLTNKRVLYIPIYSCFDYNTKALNFKSDGNVNRFLTTFSNINSYKSIDVLCPESGNDIDWFYKSFYTVTNGNCKIINSKFIVESAKVQRNIDFARNILNEVNLEDYDLVIAEGQYVVLELLDFHKLLDVIYWCPVCAIENKTRDFLEPNKALDKYIFSRVEYTIVASDEQVKYIQSLRKNNSLRFTNIIFIETLIDRNLEIFSYDVNNNIIETLKPYLDRFLVIYLPFRLTDRGYKFNEIIDALTYAIHQNVIVLYSNPNNCDVYSLVKGLPAYEKYIENHFIKVSLDRNTYYTILDYIDCYIPYFEDTSFINHAAVSEFKTSKKCKILKNKEELINILNGNK